MRRHPYYRPAMIRSNSSPPSPTMDALEALERQNAPPPGFLVDEDGLQRCLTPINSAIRLLGDRQLAMEGQANQMLAELKNVAQTIGQQQNLLAGAITQQHDQLNDTSRAAESLRCKQEQQSSETRRLEGSQNVLERKVLEQQEDQKCVASAVQQAWQEYSNLKKKFDEQELGRDDRQMGVNRRELDKQDSSPSAPRRESCPTVFDGSERTEVRNQVLTVNPNIRAPPRFNADHYQRWKEELSFWREIHAFASDNTLIAEMALSSTDILRTILVLFLRETREKKGDRTFEKLFAVLDKEFQKDSTERALNRMTAFNQFQRTGSENIRSFWIRFQKMLGDARICGLEITEKMSYVRALQAMNLTETQRMSILAAMGLFPDKFDLSTLKDVSTRLLMAAFKIEDVSDTLIAEVEENDHETYLAAGKGRNRPGLEKSAVKITSQGVNFPNAGKPWGKTGKGGKPVCYRCGSTEHLARDCHLPFKKVPAFGGASKSKGKTGKPIFLEQSVPFEDTPEGGEMEASERGAENTLESESMINGPEPGQEEGLDQEAYEEAWLASWWNHGTYLTYMVERQEPEKIFASDITQHESMTIKDACQCFHGIIDSGASWSIAGMPWIQRWSNLSSQDHWKRCTTTSARKFRFGDSSVFKSLGSILLNAEVSDAEGKKIPLIFQVDVLPCDVPLLISRHSLSALAATLDFKKQVLVILDNITIPTTLSPGGHVWLPLYPKKFSIIKETTAERIFLGNEIQQTEEGQEPVRIDSSKAVSCVDSLQFHSPTTVPCADLARRTSPTTVPCVDFSSYDSPTTVPCVESVRSLSPNTVPCLKKTVPCNFTSPTTVPCVDSWNIDSPTTVPCVDFSSIDSPTTVPCIDSFRRLSPNTAPGLKKAVSCNFTSPTTVPCVDSWNIVPPTTVPCVDLMISDSLTTVPCWTSSGDIEGIDSTLSDEDSAGATWQEVTSGPIKEAVRVVTVEEILKIHRQLGHATRTALKRVLGLAKYRIQEQDIEDALRRCGCHVIDSRVEKPFINKHIPSTAGEVVFADLFYPVHRSRKYPAVLFTDSLTRFTTGCILGDISHDSLVDSFFRLWLSWMGAPLRLLVDAGANFVGKKWAMMSNVFGISIVVVPVDSHHSIGRVERHVQIIEKAFLSIDLTTDNSIDYQTKFAMALAAHNSTPNSGNNISPMFAVNGRPSIIEQLLRAPIVTEHGDRYDAAEREFWNRMMAIRKAQDSIQEFDARKTVNLCLRKNHQVGSDVLLKENDMVDLWVAKKKRWQGTYRVLYDGGRTVMVENLGSVFKHPKAWVRLRTRTESIVTPESERSTLRSKPSEDSNEPSSSSGHGAPKNATKKSSPRSAGKMNTPNFGKLPAEPMDLSPMPSQLSDRGVSRSQPKRMSGVPTKRLTLVPRSIPEDRAPLEEETHPAHEGFDSLSTTKGEVRRGLTLGRIERTNQQTGVQRKPYSRSKNNGACSSTNFVIGSDFPLFVSSIWSADSQWCYDWFLDSVRSNAILSDPNFQSVNRTSSSIFLSSNGPQKLAVPYPEVNKERCLSSPEEFGDIDLARIAPKHYTQNAAAVQAIRAEIFSLLTSKNDKLSPLIIIRVDDAAHTGRKKIPTTLVVRLKSNNMVKARLCLMGDTMKGGAFPSFMSAPTADRQLLKVILSLSVQLAYDVITCDISQAFLQSDFLPDRDQYIALPPSCITLNSMTWDGIVHSDTPKTSPFLSKFAFLCRKPLYGSTDAPLRWYATFARHMRRFKYLVHRVDLCLFSKRDPLTGILVAFLIVHVDDVIMAGAKAEIDYFIQCLSIFRHGEVVFLREQSPVLYCGITLIRRGLSVGFTQDEFRSQVKCICAKDVIGPTAVYKTDQQLRSAVKAFVGGLIWMLQSRYDLSYWVVLISTSIEDALRFPEEMKIFLKNCEQASKLLLDRSVTVWYHPFPVAALQVHTPQLIMYADAGFNTLAHSSSVESFFVCYGLPIARDGIVSLAAHPISWQSRKMKRVARSSLAAESVALATAVDFSYWLRAVYVELLWGKFDYQSFNELKPAPFVIPFDYEEEISSHEDVPPVHGVCMLNSTVKCARVGKEARLSMSVTDSLQQRSQWIPLQLIHTQYMSLFPVSISESHNKVGLLILTDSANAFSAVHAGNPRTSDRLTRLHLCYIRDGLDLFNLSFIAAGFNISDAGTKKLGAVHLVGKIFQSNTCHVGFLTRAEMKTLATRALLRQ